MESDPPAFQLARPLTWQDLELAVRTAAEVYGEKMFVVVGRGSLAASLPESADRLRSTIDIDLFPAWKAEMADRWADADAEVGRYSPFQNSHGFYIERVGEWTLLTQPEGWQDRAVRVSVDDIELIVLHPLDLAYNKLEAGREKDIDFIREALSCQAFQFSDIESFITVHAPDEATRQLILQNLTAAQSRLE